MPGEAAQTLEQPAQQQPTEPAPPKAAANDDKRTDTKKELVKELQKTMRKRVREEAKAEEGTQQQPPKPAPKAKEAPKTPPKEQPKSEAAPAAKDPKAPAPKDAKEAKPGEKNPGEQSVAEGAEAETDEVKQFRAQKRDFAKFQRKKEHEYSTREQAVQQREARATERERAITTEFRRDPIAFLRSHGVDFKSEVLKWVDADNEDPRDRRLRELGEKAETAEKTAKQLAEEREREKSNSAFEHVGQVMLREWRGADADEYPYLSSMYEPAEIARMARQLAIDHFKETKARTGRGVELAPSEVFRYLEEAEREEEERRQLSRRKRQTIGPESGSESREQVPQVESSSPERRTRASDVTNRATRIATSGGSDRPTREGVRERMLNMTREAIRR